MTPTTCVQDSTIAKTPMPDFDPCVADVAIVGGSGCTGALLAELLVRRPSVRLTQVSSESLAGTPVPAHLPSVRADLEFCAQADVGGVDVAFLCTPHGQAAPVVKRLLDDGVRVIDLSADFRLEAEAYAEWYGKHPYPELIPATYGLTGLHRDEIASAALVANPYCYPTAVLDSVQQGRLAAVMQQPEISLSVALNGPGAASTVYFGDLTRDYVTLNAEYST